MPPGSLLSYSFMWENAIFLMVEKKSDKGLFMVGHEIIAR